jgi:acetyltransferase
VRLANDIGYPVVLKLAAPGLAHKTEVGGVRLNVDSDAAVHVAFREMVDGIGQTHPEVRVDGILVQEQLPAGRELILGVHYDHQFGPLVLAGLGGVFAEALQDTVVRVPPIDEGAALEMLDHIQGRALLQSHRGAGPADVGAVVPCIVALSHLALDMGELLEDVDINPVIVFDQGKGARVVDALFVLRAQKPEN